MAGIPESRWSWGDRLAMALACLAAIMALILFWIDKTPLAAGITIVAMIVLVIYPVLHFVSSKRARSFVFLVCIALIALFGWKVWPKESLKVGATVQPPQHPISLPPPLVAPTKTVPSSENERKPITKPARTEADLAPYTLADVNKIVNQIMHTYQVAHPTADRTELKEAINQGLKRDGYPFRLRSLPEAHPVTTPSLLVLPQGVHLIMSGITMKEMGPHNGMTAISTGDGSPVTVNGGGIEGFDNGIKTGNDAPVELNGAHISNTNPNTSTEKEPETKPQ
jgi:hypothetical protein